MWGYCYIYRDHGLVGAVMLSDKSSLPVVLSNSCPSIVLVIDGVGVKPGNWGCWSEAW